MFGGFAPAPIVNSPRSIPELIYASPSARCHANSPSDRPAGSGRKSYCVGGSAFRSLIVLAASRSHQVRNISSSFIATAHLLQPFRNGSVNRRRTATNAALDRASRVWAALGLVLPQSCEG